MVGKSNKRKSKHKKESWYKELNHWFMNKFNLIGFKIILIFFILGILIVFVIPFPMTVLSPYMERQPYTEMEKYYEEIPYQDKKCINIEPKYDKECYADPVSEGKSTRSITITNVENQPSTFTFTLNSYDADDNLIDSYGPAKLTIGSNKVATRSYTLKSTYPGKYNCIVEADKIEKCETITAFKNLEKTRSVTKYKDVQKEKYITLYATLFQRWLGTIKKIGQ